MVFLCQSHISALIMIQFLNQNTCIVNRKSNHLILPMLHCLSPKSLNVFLKCISTCFYRDIPQMSVRCSPTSVQRSGRNLNTALSLLSMRYRNTFIKKIPPSTFTRYNHKPVPRILFCFNGHTAYYHLKKMFIILYHIF